MLSGRSNRKGIMFSDSSASGTNAVFCWREGNEVVALCGPSAEISPLFDEETKAGKSKSVTRRQNRTLAWLTGTLLSMVVVSALFGSPLLTAAAVAFALTGFFPAAALLLTVVPRYESEEDSRQMKRYHGAEHAAIAFWRANKNDPRAIGEASARELASYSHIDPECGTVYLSSALVWAIVLAATIVMSPTVGATKSAVFFLGFGAALLANAWFNPLNPLKAAQLPMVEKPTERELEVAIEGLKKLAEATGSCPPRDESFESDQA